MITKRKWLNSPVIVWRNRLFDFKKGKAVTHCVSSINIDSIKDTVSVVIEKGLSVDTVELSMENAQDIGFINVNALVKYCK